MNRGFITSTAVIALLFSPISAFCESTEQLEERIEKLEKDLEKANKRSRKYYDRLNKKISNQGERVKLNAFASAGLAKSDSQYSTFNEIDETTINTQADSILGVQMSFQVNDKTELTTQFVSKGGQERHNTRTEWAYISYTPNKNVKIRAGRMRIPYYMLSESLEVGYSYNWVRPPAEVYNLTSNNGELFDVILSKSISSLNLNWQIFGGRLVESQRLTNQQEVRFEADDVLGTAVYGNVGDFSGRIGYVTFDFSSVNSSERVLELTALTESLGLGSIKLRETKTQYLNIGGKYDNGKTQIMGEFYTSDFEDTLLSITEGWYLTAGYRIGDWTPFVSFAKVRTTNDDDREDAINALLNIPGPVARSVIFADGVPPTLSGLPDSVINEQARSIFVNQVAQPTAITMRRIFNFRQQTTSLGVRWDIKPGLALKLQVDEISGFEDTRGQLNVGNDPSGLPAPLTDDSVIVNSLVIDAAF